MYDSESSRVETGFSESSELDSSRKVQPNNCQLKDQNEELMKENTLLRSQFEDAIKITEQLESVHQQNNDLLQQVRTLRKERDDLEHRLEISLNTIKEKDSKLNEEKRSCSTIRGTDLTSMTKEIEKVKAQSKAQLESVYDQLEKAKQATERENVEKRLLASKLDHILEDAKRYFGTTFTTLDDFITFLSTPPSIQDTPTPVQGKGTGLIPGVTKSNDPATLEKKIKHLKQKIKAANETSGSLEQQIKKQQQDFAVERSDLKSTVRTLEQKCDMYASQKSQIENQMNYQIQALNTKNAQLNKKIDSLNDQIASQNSEIKKLKKQAEKAAVVPIAPIVAPPQPIPQDPNAPKVDSIQPQIIGLSSPQTNPSAYNCQGVINDELLEKNRKLTNDLAIATKKVDQLTDQLNTSNQNATELAIALEKNKSDLEALKHVHEADSREIDSLRNALHIKEDGEKELRENRKGQGKLPCPRVEKLQRALDKEKKKVYTLETNENKLTTRIEDLEASLRLADQTKQDAESDAKKAREDLESFRRKVESQSPPTADDLLPPCVFRCEDFDPTLQSAIVRIANNPDLQVVSKLQNCFKTIRKHYSKQISERDAALDQAFTENQTLSNSFNQFLVDASIALNDTAVTLQDFFANNAGRNLVDQIASCRADQANMRHQFDSLKNFISQFQNTFSEFYTEPVDSLTQMREVLNVIEQQKNAIIARSKKVHELKNLVRSQNTALKNQQNDYENKIQELDEANKELQSTVANLQEENKSLIQHNKEISAELQNVTAEREQLETTLMQDQETLNTTMLEEVSKNEKKLKEKLKTLNDENHTLRQNLAIYEQELNKQKNAINQLKLSRQQKEQENDELHRKINDDAEAAAERLEAEKRNITASFENAIIELKEQCEKHRNDVQKMAAQVSDIELKNAKLVQDMNQIRKEKRKMEVEVATVKSQTERERKLMESQIRAQKIQAEGQYNQKLEEQRVRAEAEKRRLLAIGTDAFRSYFNPSQQIDERSFKTVLENARETIQKLQNSDSAIRRMLCAADNQTTQDAVAQMLMGGCTA
ncbi:hypothetical protein M9Y10_042110 [Tritrichomonas musculus]|uniref:Uncharacterized protein n=1 Tax=Tritrichomonas musculus TaxID=1915356 RepID=A0ABR2K6F4_9EUKA